MQEYFCNSYKKYEKEKRGVVMENRMDKQAENKIFYDRIVLLALNNKLLSVGMIDEKTKMNIDRQIETAMR